MHTFTEASGVGSKINAFAVDPAERRVFAGTLQGELVVVDVESFHVVHRVLVAAGQIEGVAVHPSLPIVGVFSADNMITLWRYDDSSNLTHMFDIATRQIRAENPELERPLDGATFSSSYALAFHPTERPCWLPMSSGRIAMSQAALR